MFVFAFSPSPDTRAEGSSLLCESDGERQMQLDQIRKPRGI